MAQQLIVYDKESGVISQILLFTQTLTSIPSHLIPDPKRVGIIVVDEKKYINIKKDRVINGKLVQAEEAKSKNVITVSEHASKSMFEPVQYTRLPEHVAMITPWNKECGISNYSKDLIDNLDCKISVFCGKDDSPDYPNPKVKVFPTWTNRDTSYKYLVEALKKQKVDVAHVQYNHDLMNAGQLKIFGQELKAAGIRSIMTLHSTKGGVDIYGKFFDNLVVHTDVSAKDLIGNNTKHEQIVIIPIGTGGILKNKEKKIACIEKEIDYTRPIVANFGFLLPQKGIKEQIRAIDLIKQDKPNVLLLVICSIHKLNETVSTAYLKECETLVKELQLENNVIFKTDYLPYDEIFDWLHCSDVVVLPYVNSAAQANSSAGRTAIMASRPVLTTDVEIFADFKGIIPQVEAKNITELAIGITEILSNDRTGKEILEKIRAYAEDTSWENVGRHHMKMYKAFGDIKIDIEGQVYSYFSASVVNRNLACSLNDLGVDVTLKSVKLAENESYDLGDASKDLINKKQNKGIHVRHQFPPNFVDYFGKTNVAYLGIETSVPDEWVDAIENSPIDYIWVYSNHSKELVKKSAITKPCEVIRCGYDASLFNMDVKPIDLSRIPDSHTKKPVSINDETFVFMFIGHAQERKNFKTIFKSYLTEFTVNDNVLFVIKSYDGGEVHKTILELVGYVTGITGKSKEMLPKYLYVYEDTKPDVLPTYYRAANVLVQCSRAEGFGKPIVEAQALGIPSICVLFSGPKDFCTEKNAFPVPFELVKSSYHVQSKAGPSLWAETKEEDLRNVMRFCFDNPDEVKQRGIQALQDSKRWSTLETAFDVIKFVRKYQL